MSGQVSRASAINQIIKNLVEQHGVVLLNDISKMNALLMDYAPHSNKERKLIVMAMKEGIVSQLIKITNENEENQKLRLNRCVKQLVESIWITEVAAKYAVLVLASAIGINVRFDTDEETSKVQNDVSNLKNESSHQDPPSLGFSRKEHWSGLPFPSPMHESEK